MTPPPAATTFIVEDAPGTSQHSTYAYWQSGYSFSAPDGSLPYGYPPGPSQVQGATESSSTSTFQAAPDVPASADYVATPCPDCGQMIKVSSATTYHMEKHRESQRCKRASARRTMKEEEAKASALRMELFTISQGQGASHGADQGGISVGNSANASVYRVGEIGTVNSVKGKSREVSYSNGADLGKRYRDAGIQADLLLPQRPGLEVGSARGIHRRCQSEPPISPSTEIQAEFPVQDREHTYPTSAGHTDDKLEKETVICLQCAETLLKRNVRSHVGGHVLRQLVGALEGPNMKHVIHPGNPCGFCGRAGCDIQLVKAHSPASKYTTVASNCSHAHTFSLNKARRTSNVMPCTNIPIQCTLCPKDSATKLRPVYWKYNMFYHIQTAHPDHWDWQAGGVKNLGLTFRRLLAISQKELDTVAPGYTRPYPGPVGEVADVEEERVISNKRAAVEALMKGASGESSPKRLKEL